MSKTKTDDGTDSRAGKSRIKRNLISFAFLILLLILTLWMILKDNDIVEIWNSVLTLEPVWSAFAVFAALFFVSAEGFMIWYILRSLKCGISLPNCIGYSFVGFFFSGITPSASGGQPMQLYYMSKDKIKIADSTVTLTIVATFYKFILVLIGIVVAIFWGNLLTKYLSGYIYPNGSYILGNGGVSIGATDRGLPNNNLTWYKSKTTNLGFEASAYKGLISIEFDYFIRLRDGLLANKLLSLPTTFGITLPQENLNSDKTKGFEIIIGHHNKVGNLDYDIKANFSTTRNYNRHVERANPSNMYDNWRNNSNNRVKGIQWGKVSLGQFKSYEEILNSPIQDGNGNKSLQPGDIKFEDYNNDGIIDSKDDQPIGHGSDPHMYYGLNTSANYKNFDLTIFFQGAAGHVIFLGTDFVEPFFQQGLGSGMRIWMNRWHRADPTDLNSEWIAGDMPSLRPTGFSLNEQQSTWTRQKASYLRLKTIEVGYTLDKKLIKIIGIQSLRIYFNAFNLLTFTSKNGMMKWMDPENNENSLRYYPQMKTFNFGLNLSI